MLYAVASVRVQVFGYDECVENNCTALVLMLEVLLAG